MKKGQICLLIIILLVWPYLSRKNLYLVNMRHYIIPVEVRTSIINAGFIIPHFTNITLKDIKKIFTLCDNVMMITMEESNEYCRISASTPVFYSAILQISFYARIENETFYGDDMGSGREHYIWTPWRWYHVKNDYFFNTPDLKLN